MKIAVVYALATASAASVPFAAAAASEPLETVLVTAPLHKTAEQTALPVTVLNGEALQRQVSSSIGATLANSPGLANSSFGPGVGQPVIRGQHGPRVQVLENGMASADASGVSADHAVSVEPMLADSIEVLRGPSTLLYGGGAIGGVINVIDSRIPKSLPDHPVTGALETRYDSVDRGSSTVARLDGGMKALAWHLDGSYHDYGDQQIPGNAFNADVLDTRFSSVGSVVNTRGRDHSGSAGASWVGDGGYLGFSVSALSKTYGIPLNPDAMGLTVNGTHIDLRQTRYAIAGEHTDLAGPIETARWHLAYTDYQHREIENGGGVGTTFTNDTWENRLELVHRPLGAVTGVVGLQLKHSDFAALGAQTFIPRSVDTGTGLFAIEDYTTGDITWELGLRYDRDGVDPGASVLGARRFNNASGSLSAMWALSPGLNLAVAASRSQRAPTTEELFSNALNPPGALVAHDATATIEVGNTHLRQETSRNLDVTLRFDTDVLAGYVTLFYNDFADYIALTNSGTFQGGIPIYDYTQRDARFSGAEFKATRTLAPTQLGTVELEIYGDAVRGHFADGGNVPRMPPVRLGTRLALVRGSLSAWVGLLHAWAQDRAGRHETPTDAYNRLDAGISYRFGLSSDRSALLFVYGHNLANATIRNSVSLLRDVAPEPARSIETGVQLSF